MNFQIIPSGDLSRVKEVAKLGNAGAARFQTLLYRIMDHLGGGEYNGGSWDLREYENGAVMWVFDQDRQINVNTFNGYEVTCSMLVTSMAANLIALSALMGEVADRDPKSPDLIKMAANSDLVYDVARTLSQAERTAFARIID